MPYWVIASPNLCLLASGGREWTHMRNGCLGMGGIPILLFPWQLRLPPCTSGPTTRDDGRIEGPRSGATPARQSSRWVPSGHDRVTNDAIVCQWGWFTEKMAAIPTKIGFSFYCGKPFVHLLKQMCQFTGVQFKSKAHLNKLQRSLATTDSKNIWSIFSSCPQKYMFCFLSILS